MIMVPIMSFNDHDSYHDDFFVQNDSESVTNRFYCQMPSRVIMTRFNCTGRLTNRFYRMTDAVAAATIVFAFVNDQLISYRQSSTRISAALAKATVMRITGTRSLPAPTYLLHVNLARNCPGPADALPRRTPLRSRPGPSTGQLHPFTPSTPIPPPRSMLRAAA